ncbi:hypothetical protein PG987_015680 [Apiospora arundinis]
MQKDEPDIERRRTGVLRGEAPIYKYIYTEAIIAGYHPNAFSSNPAYASSQIDLVSTRNNNKHVKNHIVWRGAASNTTANSAVHTTDPPACHAAIQHESYSQRPRESPSLLVSLTRPRAPATAWVPVRSLLHSPYPLLPDLVGVPTPHPSISSSSSSSSRLNTHRRRPTFLPPFDFELNLRSPRHHPPAHLRPLNFYFGPHLNNDVKRRRAVHEYMLCRVTQELTASFIHHILLVLLYLPFFSRHDNHDDEPNPPPPDRRREPARPPGPLRRPAPRARLPPPVRGRHARIRRPRRAHHVVPGPAPADRDGRRRLRARPEHEWAIFRRAEQPPGLAARFRARYGDSYRSYRDYRYHPTPFRSRRWYAEWREGPRAGPVHHGWASTTEQPA